MCRIDGACANERGAGAHKRIGGVHTKDSFQPSFVTAEATSERDVAGPTPMFARLPNMRGAPFALSITDRGRCVRGENVPSRKRYKQSVVDSAAAMVRRKGDSFPCFKPGDSSQEGALRFALGINRYEKLLACALRPADQASVKYNCLGSNRAKLHTGAG